jgi:glycosyltransferase involved in cell wall biosynthesis
MEIVRKSSKHKVLLVSPYSSSKVGGIGTWTKNLLDFYNQESNFNLLFLNTAHNFKANVVKNKFSRIFHGIYDSIIIIFSFIIKTLILKPNTIHYTSSGSFALYKDYIVVKWAKIIGVKFIIHWRFGRIPEIYQENNSEWKLFTKIAKQADISIVLDQKSSEVLVDFGIKNVKIIPNPISKNLQNIAEKIEFKNEMHKDNCIIYVGHIIPEKGIRELIRAFCSIKEQLNLIMIGPVNKKFKNEMLNLLAKHDKIEFVLWSGEIKREEVFHYLKMSKALCLPSYTEGFPNVIIEAMALGCPVVATKVGAIEHMITSPDMGQAGICIDAKNVEQLTNSILFILENNDKALNFGKNGNKRVLTKYTMENIYNQYQELWLN